MKKSLFAIIAFMLVAMSTYAQKNKANQSVSITIPEVLEIQIQEHEDDYTFNDSTGIENGTKDAFATAKLRVKANQGWKVTMTATDMAATINGSVETIARAALSYDVDGGSNTPLAGNSSVMQDVIDPQTNLPIPLDLNNLALGNLQEEVTVFGSNTIKTGGDKGGWGKPGHTMNVAYNVDLTEGGNADPLEYSPGTYEMDIVYTVSAE